MRIFTIFQLFGVFQFIDSNRKKCKIMQPNEKHPTLCCFVIMFDRGKKYTQTTPNKTITNYNQLWYIYIVQTQTIEILQKELYGNYGESSTKTVQKYKNTIKSIANSHFIWAEQTFVYHIKSISMVWFYFFSVCFYISGICSILWVFLWFWMEMKN